MNTPAHMALGLAVLGTRRQRGAWWAILLGAFLPDAFLFAEHFWRGTPGALIDAFNSVFVYGAAAVLGWLGKIRWLLLLALSALLHIALDIPLHVTDAHVHLWPVTDAVFRGPVSFWDARHGGALVGTLEGVLFAVCLFVIWRRLRTRTERFLAVGFAAIYAAAFVHFAGHVFAGVHWAVW